MRIFIVKISSCLFFSAQPTYFVSIQVKLILNCCSRSDESTPASTTTTTTTTTSQQVVDDGTGCGTRIGCFRNPDGCLPESSGCQFLSWTYVSDLLIEIFFILTKIKLLVHLKRQIKNHRR